MSEAPHRVRRTARVLLFDPDDRLLLLKGRLPSAPEGPGWWYTVGGGIEEGESEDAAARREILEETGFAEVELGPVAFRLEQTFRDRKDRLVLQTEAYFTARCAAASPSRDGWQPIEVDFVDDVRWWTLTELRACHEPMHPPDLARRVADLLVRHRSAANG